jgi:single-strand DNA-binding protein
MNIVILVGNLTKDNELKMINANTSVLKNTVAVQRAFKNANGGYDADFINITAFGTTAEYLSKYSQKGTKIALHGRWQHSSYETQDGKRYVDEVIVEKAEIVVYPQKEEEPKQVETDDFFTSKKQFNVNYDDLPF